MFLILSETSCNHALMFSNMSCNIVLKEVLIVHDFIILELFVFSNICMNGFTQGQKLCIQINENKDRRLIIDKERFIFLAEVS